MNGYPLPHLSGSDTQKLSQLQSYLYRLVEQLNNTDLAVTHSAPAPAAIPQKTPFEQFSSIKSLIIKSADIVNAYYDAIEKRLQGLYVAESDFGVYREETSALLQANAKELSALFENTESIESMLSDIEGGLSKVTARLKAGLLYHDESGQAVYGLEIGQRTFTDGKESFSKFARFTSERLSFYDKNEIEVAYISDYKLFITSAEVKGSLRIGGYTRDGTNGLCVRWTGE